MNCACDCDSPAVTWKTTQTARKEHKCCECGSTIGIGEKYYQIKGVWDSAFETYRMCMPCSQVTKAAVSDGICFCLGDLWETVGTNYEDAARQDGL